MDFSLGDGGDPSGLQLALPSPGSHASFPSNGPGKEGPHIVLDPPEQRAPPQDVASGGKDKPGRHLSGLQSYSHLHQRCRQTVDGKNSELIIEGNIDINKQFKRQEELPHTTRWYNTVVNQTEIKSILDKINFRIAVSEGGKF